MRSSLEEWCEMVAHHAAKYAARGLSHGEAISRGMADYTAQLERLWGLYARAGFGDEPRRRAEHRESICQWIAERVHAAR